MTNIHSNDLVVVILFFFVALCKSHRIRINNRRNNTNNTTTAVTHDRMLFETFRSMKQHFAAATVVTSNNGSLSATMATIVDSRCQSEFDWCFYRNALAPRGTQIEKIPFGKFTFCNQLQFFVLCGRSYSIIWCDVAIVFALLLKSTFGQVIGSLHWEKSRISK